jgi:hypothetical protein
MLNCTWDDREAELVLRKVQLAREEQQRLRNHYQALREQYRQSQQPAAEISPGEEASE